MKKTNFGTVGDGWSYDQGPDTIKEAVQKFYEGLYKETEQWRLGLRLHDVSRITEED